MPQITEKAILLTADLIRRRDDVRRLLGDRYDKQIRGYRELLRKVVMATDRPLMEVALEMAKNLSEAGHDPSFLIAAAVDECQQQEVNAR